MCVQSFINICLFQMMKSQICIMACSMLGVLCMYILKQECNYSNRLNANNSSLCPYCSNDEYSENRQYKDANRLCQQPSDVVLKVCSITDTIDVVLTVWKRDNLVNQLNDVENQTKKVSRVLVVQNKNHVKGVARIVDKWKQTHNTDIDIVTFTGDSGYHGRFHMAYALSDAEYVSVWDDDVHVGHKWLEYCIEQSKIKSDALVGATGRSILHIYQNNRFQLQKEFIGAQNDFIIHTYTMKRQLLRFFIGKQQITYATGEDMQLAFALQLRGIISWNPNQYNDGRFVRDISHLNSDKHASHLQNHHIPLRNWLLCRMILDGFRLLNCSNCNVKTAKVCVDDLIKKSLVYEKLNI